MEYPGQSRPNLPMHDHPVCDMSPCTPCTPTPQKNWCVEGYPLAMVYAPCQAFQNLYDLPTALSHGTLFSELDLPILTTERMSGKNCGCGRGLEQ